MKFLILLEILTIGTAFAVTHVNISFSQQQQQQHSQNAANLAEARNEQVQLRPSDSFEQFQTSSNYRGDQNDRLARIQVEDKKANDNYNNHKVADDSKLNHEPTSNYQSRSERVKNSGRSGHFNHQSHEQQRGFYNSNNGDHQQYDQFRKMSALDKQNMEFERYIQNYHSGPTVETVYESAKPRSQQTSVTSSVNEGPQRLVAINQRMSKVQKFERQVALPSTADNIQPVADTNKHTQTVVNHQPVLAAETAASTGSLPSSSSTSTSSSSSSLPSVSSTNGHQLKVNLNPEPASVGKDGLNFELSTSYNKPNYNEPTFKYDNNDGHSDGQFHNQYPPSVDEPQGGYGDYFQPSYGNNDNHYYGNFYDHQQPEAGYLPAEHINQRPVVTKTIQIAQPAIKAKKYEIRHPAIQKEFYDIEERVLIKPAGTVVVELERPVSKILKGETTLPLGHPHPAVAGAYTNNRNTPAFSNIVYSSAGGSSSNHGNNQFSPNYNAKNTPEHHTASSVATSPTYDQSNKEVIAESNLNKQYNGDNMFVAAATAEEPKSQNRDYARGTQQRQVSRDQFTYSRDETDKVPTRPVYNNRNSFGYSDNNGQVNLAPQRSGFQESNHNNGQANIAPQRSGFQANLSNRDGFGFDAEYINNAGSANLQEDSKPARLQEASPKMTAHQQQPIIKHEHNIVLSPSQHNIYLSRKVDVPQTKFIEEAAHVREIKPYLQNQQGPMIVYASSQQRPAYGQRSEYQPQQSRVPSQVVHYRDPARVTHAKGADKRVEYSAPYAQMRHHPDDEQYVNYDQQQRGFSNYDRNGRRKSEKLILEDKPTTEMIAKTKSNDNMMEKQAPQAHIEIEIPHNSPQDANKAIFVSSTIRPMVMDNGKDQMHNSKLEISITNNGEPMQKQQNTNDTNYEKDNNEQQHNMQYSNDNDNDDDHDHDKDSEQLSNFKTKPDCDQPLTAAAAAAALTSAHYESKPEHSNYGQQKFMRIQEASSSSATSANDGKSADEPAATNIQPHNVDVNVKSTAGHVRTPGSRVIAATPAPKESAPSESFHKRRIVVNHPFQTVREVVEHEPYTNYHEVQVNEPASPALYHSANYFQSNGALRQPEHGHSIIAPVYYH